jgi:hypothetical protein
VIVSDDLASYRLAADQLQVEHQVCLWHVELCGFGQGSGAVGSRNEAVAHYSCGIFQPFFFQRNYFKHLGDILSYGLS